MSTDALEEPIERPDDITDEEWDLVMPFTQMLVERNRYKAELEATRTAHGCTEACHHRGGPLRAV